MTMPSSGKDRTFGHGQQWREWRAAVSGARMHHAWLLTGQPGLGKAAFARRAAAELVAEAGVSQPPPEAHPDILWLTPPPATADDEKRRDEGKPFATRRNINVEQMRTMQRRLTTRPTLGPRRAIVIDAADDLETSAVNALLKSLEEPPAGSTFLLVSHRPGGLLPTVRSRCRLLRFTGLADVEVAAVVAEKSPETDPKLRAAAVAAARGAPGAALAFVAQDLAPIRRELLGILAHGDEDFARRGALAGAIGQRPDRERLLATIDLARGLCAERLADSPPAAQRRLIEAHALLVRLRGEIPTANYDPGLAVVEIGGLLAAAAMA